MCSHVLNKNIYIVSILMDKNKLSFLNHKNQIVMSDRLSKLLNEHGFSFVKMPRPIQLLDLFAKDSRGHLISIGNITDLFLKKAEPLPENTLNQPVPSEIGGLIDKKVDMKLSINLLKGFLPESVGVESAFSNANNINFSFNDAKLDSTSLIQLDIFINDANIQEKSQTFKDKLKDSEIYVVTDVLKSKSFSVEALGANDTSIALDGPEIEKIIEANAKLKRTSENKAKIVYEGDNNLAIGIRAAQIHNNKSWLMPWKDLSFSLRSGKTHQVRGESAAAPKIDFLNQKFVQIETE